MYQPCDQLTLLEIYHKRKTQYSLQTLPVVLTNYYQRKTISNLCMRALKKREKPFNNIDNKISLITYVKVKSFLHVLEYLDIHITIHNSVLKLSFSFCSVLRLKH